MASPTSRVISPSSSGRSEKTLQSDQSHGGSGLQSLQRRQTRVPDPERQQSLPNTLSVNANPTSNQLNGANGGHPYDGPTNPDGEEPQTYVELAEDLWERGYEGARSRGRRFWDRLRGKGRNVPGWKRSLKNIVLSSPLNVLLVFLPVAWIARWKDDRFSEGEKFACEYSLIIEMGRDADDVDDSRVFGDYSVGDYVPVGW